MVISEMQEADYPHYLQLLRQLVGETPFLIYSAEEIEALEHNARLHGWKNRPHRQIWLTWVDNRAVGYLVLSRGAHLKNQHVASLMTGVLRDYWGNGAAAVMLQRGEQWARDQGIRRIELTLLEENDRAHAFYRRHDFVDEGRRRQSIRLEDADHNISYHNEISMAKLLSVQA